MRLRLLAGVPLPPHHSLQKKTMASAGEVPSIPISPGPWVGMGGAGQGESEGGHGCRTARTELTGAAVSLSPAQLLSSQ